MFIFLKIKYLMGYFRCGGIDPKQQDFFAGIAQASPFEAIPWAQEIYRPIVLKLSGVLLRTCSCGAARLDPKKVWLAGYLFDEILRVKTNYL